MPVLPRDPTLAHPCIIYMHDVQTLLHVVDSEVRIIMCRTCQEPGYGTTQVQLSIALFACFGAVLCQTRLMGRRIYGAGVEIGLGCLSLGLECEHSHIIRDRALSPYLSKSE